MVDGPELRISTVEGVEGVWALPSRVARVVVFPDPGRPITVTTLLLFVLRYTVVLVSVSTGVWAKY